ncbi:putative Rossmann fold enzyme [Methanocalculus alkaliphilus]|uniref:6-hydroxymethylpterin diphosphokinase MptE-like protein n=1 Tax=Methanocalculus alkaliphilus TaxID=768730 RepID=UPI0020A1C0A7|nr:6-hydroxymethylpterin diphosphokinase MptE-like protein [Methanocalculus alkaliphilus]MCP1714917.1 putative Rossmann fold enzyme [Methanocalculus alkaliphilus]
MRFEEFEPHYREILDYFGFDRADDEEAALLLNDLLDRDDLALLRDRISGNAVTVCGNAEILREQLREIDGVVIAADAAALVLYDAGIIPDIIFTDLDGADDPFITMNEEGTLIVVHAHGDNTKLLSRWVPRLTGPLVGTTQSRPLPGIHNFGGFTDGDRAVFAADELGAATITILGFDLSDTSVDPMKRGKLLWARKLLGMIGYDL